MSKKLLILMVLICYCLSFHGRAQNAIPVKYYNDSWKACEKDSAFYFIEYIKMDEGYNKTIYWAQSKKIYSKSSITDTGILSKRIGTAVLYFENGNILDSTIYNKPDKRFEVWRYYSNSQLNVHCIFDTLGNTTTIEGFDSTGKVIPDYVFGREAEFPGGNTKWQKYIMNNLKTDFRKKDFKNDSSYTKNGEMKFVVRVKFMINKDGEVANVEIEKSSGNAIIDKDALSVISNSPKWINAIQYNQPVNSYRRQPITYMIE